MQRVAEGIKFLTHPPVSLSALFFCLRNSSKIAQQNFLDFVVLKDILCTGRWAYQQEIIIHFILVEIMPL